MKKPATGAGPASKTAGHGQSRTYRRLVHGHLQFSRVTVQETDLGIYASSDVVERARALVFEQRGYLEGYIRRHADFVRSLTPLATDDFAPPIVRGMLRAAKSAGVGPMAAVAGAVAEQVGRGLLQDVDEVIVENGGDVFIRSQRQITIGIFAGRSPLSLKIGLKLDPGPTPVAVCTSSGTVGHSLSLGGADAVCVVSASCPLADAAATAIGNQVRQAADIESAIQGGRGIEGVDGILVIAGEKMGMWGRIALTALHTEAA